MLITWQSYHLKFEYVGKIHDADFDNAISIILFKPVEFSSFKHEVVIAISYKAQNKILRLKRHFTYGY